MEKEEFKELFKSLMAVNNPSAEIEKLYDRAINSGAMYLSAEPEDSYRLPKILYYAILCEMCEQWRPSNKRKIKEAKNLRLFL